MSRDERFECCSCCDTTDYCQAMEGQEDKHRVRCSIHNAPKEDC